MQPSRLKMGRVSRQQQRAVLLPMRAMQTVPTRTRAPVQRTLSSLLQKAHLQQLSRILLLVTFAI
ncbi:MAG: hypothetical protein APF80_17250 [Alphaproteobacteria bacterium BRH_c36]|nr:MAG: hypothetical protein APF80_17250 [Alphaproteobacteria bacterium BRH_c36]